MDAAASYRFSGMSPYDLFPGQGTELITYGASLMFAITIAIESCVFKSKESYSYPDHLMYCTKMDNINNITYTMSTTHCDDLPKQQRREIPDSPHPQRFLYCSKVLEGNNATFYAETVPCDLLMSPETVLTLPEEPIFERAVPRYYCPVKSFQKSPESILSWISFCGRSNKTGKNYNEIGLEAGGIDIEFQQGDDDVQSLSYAFITLALSAVFVRIRLFRIFDKNADIEDMGRTSKKQAWDWAPIKDNTNTSHVDNTDCNKTNKFEKLLPPADI